MIEVLKLARDALEAQGLNIDGSSQLAVKAKYELRKAIAEFESQESVQELVESRCANCGKASSNALEILSDYPEDGEWFCSTECRDQHNELDCPHLTHNGYRHPVESAKLIQCERIMRELAAWLGCGGYNADKFIPSEFEAKIRHGIEHQHPPAAQPQRTWVGLTNEEKKLLWEKYGYKSAMCKQFVQLFEDKLKEKNGY